jgi:hypothetical protein
MIISTDLNRKEKLNKYDIENPEAKIDFILQRVDSLIKNHLKNNSKFYIQIEDKLEKLGIPFNKV